MESLSVKTKQKKSMSSYWSWCLNFSHMYSPTVGYGSIGGNDINHIMRLCLSLDTLISRTTRAPAKKRNSMKRAQARLRKHSKFGRWSAALWLVRTFDVIILPTFNDTQMSRRRRGRRLNNRTVRKMISWAKRLVSKVEEFDEIFITSVSEAYTGKTCSNLGILREIWMEMKRWMWASD